MFANIMMQGLKCSSRARRGTASRGGGIVFVFFDFNSMESCRVISPDEAFSVGLKNSIGFRNRLASFACGEAEGTRRAEL